MPTYDYRCDRCEHEFEQFQSITAPPLKKCPACGKPALRRLLGTGGGILFKGSGFYQTDYRSESYKSAAAAEKDTGAPRSTKNDTPAAGGAKEGGAPSKSTPPDPKPTRPEKSPKKRATA